MQIKFKDPSNVSNLENINNEKILFKAYISKIIYTIPASLLMVSIFLFIIQFPYIFSISCLVVTIFAGIIVKLYVLNSFILFTETKIYYYFGILSDNSDMILINKVSKLETRQSIFDMVFNIGNIIIVDNSGEREEFYFIKNPKHIKNSFATIFK